MLGDFLSWHTDRYALQHVAKYFKHRRATTTQPHTNRRPATTTKPNPNHKHTRTKSRPSNELTVGDDVTSPSSFPLPSLRLRNKVSAVSDGSFHVYRTLGNVHTTTCLLRHLPPSQH